MKKLILILLLFFVKFVSAECLLSQNDYKQTFVQMFGGSCIKLNVEHDDYKLSIFNTSQDTSEIELVFKGFGSSDFTSLKTNKNSLEIIFSYPRVDYIINLNLENHTFLFNSVLYINNGSDKTSQNGKFTLKNDKIIGKELTQSNLDTIFDKKNLSLDGTSSLTITSPKAYFYDKPNENSKTKKYVILGDKIIVTKFDNDFFYAQYTNSKNIKTVGWVKINEML